MYIEAKSYMPKQVQKFFIIFKKVRKLLCPKRHSNMTDALQNRNKSKYMHTLLFAMY